MWHSIDGQSVGAAKNHRARPTDIIDWKCHKNYTWLNTIGRDIMMPVSKLFDS